MATPRSSIQQLLFDIRTRALADEEHKAIAIDYDIPRAVVYDIVKGRMGSIKFDAQPTDLENIDLAEQFVRGEIVCASEAAAEALCLLLMSETTLRIDLECQVDTDLSTICVVRFRP